MRRCNKLEEEIVGPLRKILIEDLELDGEIKIFGSFLSGFAGKNSDLDVTYLPGCGDKTHYSYEYWRQLLNMM